MCIYSITFSKDCAYKLINVLCTFASKHTAYTSTRMRTQTRLGVLLLAESYHHQDYYSIFKEIAPEVANARPAGKASERAGTGPLKVARLPHLHTVVSMGTVRKPYASCIEHVYYSTPSSRIVLLHFKAWLTGVTSSSIGL